MNPELARKTIGEAFRQKFDDARFLYFIRNGQVFIVEIQRIDTPMCLLVKPAASR